MKKILKIIQSVCLCAIVCTAETMKTAIITLVLAIVLGACAYAEGLFNE